MNNIEPKSEGVKVELPDSTPPVVLHSMILKEIRSWAITLLILGALSLFASSLLSAPWGVLLIIVGLASFYFRSSDMMVVYGVTLAWAGVSNITSGQIYWIGFALLQWFLTFRVFQKYIAFRNAEAATETAETRAGGLTPKRAASIFPWAAGALGILSLLGLAGIFIGAIIMVAISQIQAVPDFLAFLEGMIVNFGVLGIAVGLASLLSKHPRRGLAITGLVTGILTILVEIVLKYI